MALTLKTTIQFPIFAPPPPANHLRPVTEIRFSRWNNANAQKFIRHERTQKEIEDQLRFHKRFQSADKIANLHPTTTTTPTTPPPFKSTGTPSAPSRPSIPGKKSKYSKPPQNPKPSSHPAFRRIVRVRKIPNDIEDESTIKVGEKGLSYVIPEAPFEFQYSYTETPKVKPIKLREAPIAPFGPDTMPRPWTGKKPLPASKKKLEFDSFRLPPPHKKGVKPVQAPGPFLAGSGPRYVKSREEILGEPLSKEEIDALIKGCLKSERQLNMGRDGLTHNMLDNIHAHWKRKRVCKIKCKGVCTVDMDNVRQQLEEKTGGKIIYSKGGVIYLFRGRNYNYKTRPVFPLMLWKPITPVYPRLIQRVPEGLTLEEASEMRRRGRQLTPICKLGKNGVYCNLVYNVKEAFEACELVRINCQGMNGSDYRKIGAKLKDLVPCVLISFEQEHILMWRGKDWKSMFTQENDPQGVKISDYSSGRDPPAPSVESRSLCPKDLSAQDDVSEGDYEDHDDIIGEEEDKNIQSTISTPKNIIDHDMIGEEEDKSIQSTISTPKNIIDHDLIGEEEDKNIQSTISTTQNIDESESAVDSIIEDHTDSSSIVTEYTNIQANTKNSPCTEEVVSLLEKAVQDGIAIVLDDSCLDSDIIYKKAAAFAQSAPPGPTFRLQRPKKFATTKIPEKQEAKEVDEKEIVVVSERKEGEKRSLRTRKKDFKDNYLDVAPQGTLRVDELAKLLG